MEYSIHPPGADGAASDHSPWVLESCRDCIESVALIIQLCKLQPGSHAYSAPQYWPEYQLLFASYLVLLQVKTHVSLKPYLRALGDTETLLDEVEEVFHVNKYKGPLLERSLTLLAAARRNLPSLSPGYP